MYAGSGGSVAQRVTEANRRPTGDTDFAQAHRELLADSSIQFDLPAFQPPVVPEWLKSVGELLQTLAPFGRVLFWVAVASAALFLIVVIARRITSGRWAWPWGHRAAPTETIPDWQPASGPARALLREADALAAAQRYSEAAHLLLYRSIEEIDSRRPDLVQPALTSRDIAGAHLIPDRPRRAFAGIVAMVERSLFGGRPLAEADWSECRAAYEDFAFAERWR